MNRKALLHAILVGGAGAGLAAFAAGLQTLPHSPTIKGIALGALLAAISRILGMLVNLIEAA